MNITTAAVIIVALVVSGILIEKYMIQRHKRKMKQLEQREGVIASIEEDSQQEPTDE